MPKTLNFQLESIFVEEEEDHELEENRVELETHKKKRGRPRKDCEVEEVHDVEENRIEEKKKSGRHPKVPKALIIDEPIKYKSSKKKESAKENKNYIELKTFSVY